MKHDMLSPHLQDVNIMILINEISKLFFDIIRRKGEQIGLIKGYNHFLFHLSRRDGISQLELTKLTHYKAPTVSVTLQKMESDGLVRRETDESDLRQTLVYLTEKGRKLDGILRKIIKETEEYIIKDINEDELKSTKDILLKMRSGCISESRGGDLR